MIKFLLLTSLILKTKAGYDAGYCPSPITKQNFSIDSYAGRWYEIWKDASIPFEFGVSCTTATYSKLKNTTLKVQNICYYWPFTFFIINNEAAGLCNKNGECIIDSDTPPTFSD